MPPAPDAAPPTPETARQARHALWAAIAMIMVWGSNFSAQKAVFAALSPGGFLFARYLMMPVAAALLLVSRHGLNWPRVPRTDPVALLTLAGVALAQFTSARNDPVRATPAPVD